MGLRVSSRGAELRGYDADPDFDPPFFPLDSDPYPTFMNIQVLAWYSYKMVTKNMLLNL